MKMTDDLMNTALKKNTTLITTQFLILILTFCQPAYSENAKGYLEISSDLGGPGEFIIDEKLPIYASSKGDTSKGYLKLEGDYWISLADGEIDEKLLETGGIESWAIYKASSIKYYQIENGFVRVLANSVEGGVWVKLKHRFERNGSSASIGLIPVEWTPASVGTPSNWGHRGLEPWRTSGYDGFHLREQPSFKSKIVLKLDKSQHIIKYGTGQIHEKWAEVVVEEISAGLVDCYSFEQLKPHQTGKESTGWLKIISENGEPNISTGGIC